MIRRRLQSCPIPSFELARFDAKMLRWRIKKYGAVFARLLSYLLLPSTIRAMCKRGGSKIPIGPWVADAHHLLLCAVHMSRFFFCSPHLATFGLRCFWCAVSTWPDWPNSWDCVSHQLLLLSLSLYLCTAFRSLRHQIKCIYTCAEYLSIYKTRRRLRLRWESPGFSLKCWCNCANGESFVFVAFLPYGWRRGRAGIFIKKSTERADEQRGGLRFDYIPLCRPLEMRVNWLDARFSSESRRGGQKLKRTQLDTIVRQPLRLPPFISPIRLVCVVWETVSNIFPCRRLLESLKCLPMRIAILRWLLFCSKLPSSSSSSSYITRGMCGEKRSERIFFSLSYDVCRGSRALNRVSLSPPSTSRQQKKKK